MNSEREKIDSLEKEISSVKDDIGEIKNLLFKLVQNQTLNN